ncbi:MAG: TRAP transporter substrate-binding protein DctP [Pseudomonas marincola]
MSHRKIAVAAMLLCTFLLTGCIEDEAEVHSWRLQSHAINSSIDYKELVIMADNIRLMSKGRLDITPYPADAIVGGANIFEAVSNRKIEMGNGWPNWWSGQHPAWAVMNAGPFDFMNIDASMMFFLAGEGTALANELAAEKGIIWRPAWWPGMEFGLLSKEPIKSLSDLHEKRVRIGPGLPSEVLAEASGAYAIPLVPSEIRPALEANNLDVVEWTTTAGAWNLGLQDIISHAIVPAIWQPSVLADFLINKKAFSELPIDLQAILETAIKSYTLTTTLKAKNEDIKALKLFEDNGTIFSSWSKEDIELWRTASDRILNTYKKRDGFSKRLIEQKQAYKAKYDKYYEIFGSYE